MICIDSRTGSAELLPYFKKHNVGAQIVPEMVAGDFAFEGWGPDDKRILIGVERKAIRDMINSIRTGRLAGYQLPAMKEMYARSYVIIEGIWGPGERGLIEEPRRGVNGKTTWGPLTIGGSGYMYSMVDRFIVSVEEAYRGHVRFHRTSNKEETVEHIVNIFIEFAKPYTSRHAWDAVVDTEIQVKPWSFARKIAERCPGVGGKSSLAVAKAFNNLGVNIANASEEELAEILIPSGEGTRRLGTAVAKKIYRAWRTPE